MTLSAYRIGLAGLLVMILSGCASEPPSALTADGPRASAARARYDGCISRAVQLAQATGKTYPAIHLATNADGYCAESAIGLRAAIVVDNAKHKPELAEAFASRYVNDYRRRKVEQTVDALEAPDKR